MSANHQLWERLRQLDASDPDIAFLIQHLLEFHARTRDNEVNSQLLQDLVLKYAAAEKKLVRLNRELLEKQQRLDEDLKAAAEIQYSLLPQHIASAKRMSVAWMFTPCQQIGGDIFNLVRLDSDHWGIYVLDVSGHGVPAAMVAVSVYQFLQSHTGFLVDRGSDSPAPGTIRTPAEVFHALEREFPFERFTNFFTMTYFVLNARTGRLLYGNAGHPPPVLVRKSGAFEKLTQGGPPIGLKSLREPDEAQMSFGEGITDMARGDKLFVYTDGILDYQDPAGNFFGSRRLYENLERLAALRIDAAVKAVEAALAGFGGSTAPYDDITLLGLEYLGPADDTARKGE